MIIRQATTAIARPLLRQQQQLRNPVRHQLLVARTLVSKAPGTDPLELMRKDCLNRKLCNVGGYRMPGVHWVFAVAMTPPSADLASAAAAPNLRTVGIQKVGPGGIDFVMKKGSTTADSLANEQQPLAVMYTQGKYKPGQSAEQWRGDGHCDIIPLAEILDCLPRYTVTGMLVSKRMEKEGLEKAASSSDDYLSDQVSGDRLALLDKSHVTEITQRTRLELENDQVSKKELEESIQAFRFRPDRLERMHGGPDSIMWERWEWLRSPSGDCPEGSIPWNEPKNLLPH